MATIQEIIEHCKGITVIEYMANIRADIDTKDWCCTGEVHDATRWAEHELNQQAEEIERLQAELAQAQALHTKYELDYACQTCFGYKTVGGDMSYPCPDCEGTGMLDAEKLQAELAKTKCLYNDALKLVHDRTDYKEMLLDGSDTHAGVPVECSRCNDTKSIDVPFTYAQSETYSMDCPDCNTEATHADSTAGLDWITPDELILAHQIANEFAILSDNPSKVLLEFNNLVELQTLPRPCLVCSGYGVVGHVALSNVDACDACNGNGSNETLGFDIDESETVYDELFVHQLSNGDEFVDDVKAKLRKKHADSTAEAVGYWQYVYHDNVLTSNFGGGIYSEWDDIDSLELAIKAAQADSPTGYYRILDNDANVLAEGGSKREYPASDGTGFAYGA